MGRWAKAYFEKLKEQEGKDFDKKQIASIERQQILANAPVVWERLVTQIKDEVKVKNLKMCTFYFLR